MVVILPKSIFPGRFSTMLVHLTSVVASLKSCLPTNRRANKAKTSGVEVLRAHIEDLPQELYDEIKDLSLGCETGVRRICQSYKPPVQLQINHRYREAFSQAYYGDRSILMMHNSTAGMVVFGTWIESLPQASLDLLEQYGVKDISVLDDSVDVHLEIAGGVHLRLWCEMRDQHGWLKVLRIRLYEI